LKPGIGAETHVFFHLLFAHKTPIQALHLKPGIGAEIHVFFHLLFAHKTPIQALHLKPEIGTETHVSSLGVCMLFFVAICDFIISSLALTTP
jgi:hypothetical protein